MKIPEPASARDAFVTEASSGRSTARRSPIAWLLEALYVSRSREARRVIHRYRHLLAGDGRSHCETAATTDTQFRECNADADRDQTPLHAIRRTLEDA